MPSCKASWFYLQIHHLNKILYKGRNIVINNYKQKARGTQQGIEFYMISWISVLLGMNIKVLQLIQNYLRSTSIVALCQTGKAHAEGGVCVAWVHGRKSIGAGTISLNFCINACVCALVTEYRNRLLILKFSEYDFEHS